MNLFFPFFLSSFYSLSPVNLLDDVAMFVYLCVLHFSDKSMGVFFAKLYFLKHVEAAVDVSEPSSTEPELRTTFYGMENTKKVNESKTLFFK